MKKVLIALDYDPTAQIIAEKGFLLAKSMCAEVILLHVVSDPVYYSSRAYSPVMGFSGFMDVVTMQPDMVDGLKKVSQEFLDKSKEHLADETIKTMVKEGEFAETILESAKELGADIIVMGSHSRSWLDGILMGSVTEKVLHQTLIPLFIIPTKQIN